MGMKKILVIDYDQSSLAMLQGVLAKEGYEVVTAGDGQAGWDKYNKESPDLVLMEAMLPKVHGFELCQRITSERNSQATVFIMTGVYKDRVYRTEALRTYGASEYFEKPLKMTEILSSIEAVIGKPEVRPVETRPAAEPVPLRPVREPGLEPVAVEARKREKPRSDDDIFSLPADLDRLSRELPKTHKPAPVRHEPTAEARLESLADELLKTVIVETAAPKIVEAKPANGNGNGNGNADIDQFLKSALAGFDLDKEKVKVPKTAPLPEPPAPEKPAPTPPPVVSFKPKPTPPQPPAFENPIVERPKPAPSLDNIAYSSAVEPKPKVTLTPGDPGSDVSPFFTPAKPKPDVQAEKPKFQAPHLPQMSPVPVPAPKPARPVEKTERMAAPAPAPPRPRPEPVKHEPARPEPVKYEMKAREAEAIASADIFQDTDKKRDKKGFSPLIPIVAGVAVVAAVGFFLLRPKHAAPVDENLKAQQTLTQTAAPVEPVQEAPPPEVKPAPVKPKPQPKAKVEDTSAAAAETIVPQVAPSVALPQLGTQSGAGTNNSQTSAASNPGQADPPPTKTEETSPPVKTEEQPPQGTTTEAGTSTESGAAPASLAPAATAAKEGDLVELGAVTELPKIVKSVNPIYPQTAQSLGITGSITVNALIDEKGNVIDTGILKGIKDDKGLGKAAENAVKKWKFQPARKDGVAVKVWKSFVIAFKADKSPAS
jgi:TonB family protein